MGGKRQASQASQDSVSLVLPPSLYLGPCSAASSKQYLLKNSITHVLSIGASPSVQVDGVTYQRLSISDSASSSIAKVTDTACNTIDAAIAPKKGKGKILVHCSAGISRSPMVVAAYLMKRKGMTLKEALGQIVRVRPQISPNAGFLQQLKDMEMELYGRVSLDVDELPKREKDRLALFAEDAKRTPAIRRAKAVAAATGVKEAHAATIAEGDLAATVTPPDASGTTATVTMADAAATTPDAPAAATIAETDLAETVTLPDASGTTTTTAQTVSAATVTTPHAPAATPDVSDTTATPHSLPAAATATVISAAAGG
ncbi:protein-tyrosine phosphatase-like protein [Pisolithus marmoratus]|nr:protein-tyrosine phosphatase-like protein [Pisolithus marmoratus]